MARRKKWKISHAKVSLRSTRRRRCCQSVSAKKCFRPNFKVNEDKKASDSCDSHLWDFVFKEFAQQLKFVPLLFTAFVHPRSVIAVWSSQMSRCSNQIKSNNHNSDLIQLPQCRRFPFLIWNRGWSLHAMWTQFQILMRFFKVDAMRCVRNIRENLKLTSNFRLSFPFFSSMPFVYHNFLI